MDAKVATQAPSSLPSSLLKMGDRPTPNDILMLVFSLAILLAILLQKVYANSLRRVQPEFSFQPGFKVPCRFCQYFSRNSYLQCALHPVTVLTQQAVDCVDYDPPREAKRVEDQRRG